MIDVGFFVFLVSKYLFWLLGNNMTIKKSKMNSWICFFFCNFAPLKQCICRTNN